MPRIPREDDTVVETLSEGFDFEIPLRGAVEVSGFLKVTKEDLHTIRMRVPGAAVLHVHRALVIDGDTPGKDGGEHEAEINLKTGLHPFRLIYLSEGENASLDISGPGGVGIVR